MIKCFTELTQGGDPPKYKNYLFEEARKRKIADPVFTEEQEANGNLCITLKYYNECMFYIYTVYIYLSLY